MNTNVTFLTEEKGTLFCTSNYAEERKEYEKKINIICNAPYSAKLRTSGTYCRTFCNCCSDYFLLLIFSYESHMCVSIYTYVHM